MNPHAAIHVGLKQLGIESEDARDLYERVTRKRSLKLMTSNEHQAVIGELRRLGFRPTLRGAGGAGAPQGEGGASKGPRNALQGRFAKQLQAYWIDLWNLGLVRDRTDAALIAFVRRQTRIDDPKWVLDAATAARAIEAMKGWMARAAGVSWADGNDLPAYARLTGFRIAMAQWTILEKAGRRNGGDVGLRGYVLAAAGKGVSAMTARDWIGVMNALGNEVRKVKS